MYLHSFFYHVSNGKDHNPHFFTEPFTLSITDRCTVLFQTVIGSSTRIPHCHRSILPECKPKHICKLPFIFRCKHRHIRDHSHIGQIKHALMRLTVCTNQTCTVNGKYNWEILHTDIMYNLVKSPLQKGRIHRKYRMQSRCRKSCCKSDCMSFRNSHIKKSGRIFRTEPF